jgi:lysophospholipase L1-like esterase
MSTMSRLVRATLTTFLVVVGASIVATGTGHAESNGGVRVMPLGDSITDGFTVAGGYRIGLWQRFVANRNTVDFVGSLSNGPGNLGDHDHEGHSGWRIDQLDANIVGWLRATTPHTVLLHIGTNDITQNTDLPNAPNRLSALIDHITTTAPTAEVFVATIITVPFAEASVQTFNAAIPGIVRAKVNAGRHVHLVDMHSAVAASDLADGVHPNAAGYDKMATVWFNALRSVPGSLTPPASDPPPPPPAGGACVAAFALVGQWQGGFQGSVTVTAGSAAITGWTVTLTFRDGQAITNAWGATVTGAGTVSARNVDYDGSVSAGGSVEFGFLATWNGVNNAPALSCAAS